MRDGSRLFFNRLQDISWDELRARVESLEGAQITGFVTDGIIEFWLEFTFRGQKFSINNPMGELWFFAEDASCPREILDVITGEFQI